VSDELFFLAVLTTRGPESKRIQAHDMKQGAIYRENKEGQIVLAASCAVEFMKYSGNQQLKCNNRITSITD
jgi:hypothetical protein